MRIITIDMTEEHNKKWYKTKWGIAVIILLFPIVLMVLASKWIWKQNWKKEYKIAGIVGLWGFVLIVGAISDATKPTPVTTSQTTQTAPQITEQPTSVPPTTVPVKTYQYEVKKHEVKTNLENFEVLIQPNEPDPKGLAFDVKKKCNSPCNIYLYDDEKALNLQLAYDDMDIDERNAWIKQNYVFVADHTVGNINFELPNDYNDYPFRDWQYRELGGKN